MTLDLLHGLKDVIDMRIGIRDTYESRVVSKDRVLDIGGRNSHSKSRARILAMSNNSLQKIVSTDIILDYGPDIVDDICNSNIPDGSYDGIYCVAVLEHVVEYKRAIDNIYRILTPTGEIFVYVPFVYPFHDRMDYHRFTFTEVARMLGQFSEVKIFTPGKSSGYGYVLWDIVSFSLIGHFPKIHRWLSSWTNGLLKGMLWIAYHLRHQRSYSFDVTAFWWIYLRVNHGFCAWARK